MTRMIAESLKQLWSDTEGSMSVEYALLVSIIAVAGIPAWMGLRGAMVHALQNATSHLSN
jgi:Flp pilus assembly pilin Flp